MKVIISRMVRWMGQVAQMTRKRTACRQLVGKLESNKVGAGGRIMLKYTLKK